ncbi:hypothetical protein NP493_1579g00045 [Ridgeia piscesae]|uniref:G-protein coupled receptors family 1 profile domain-containing protein n=1 Tax=Ridgeia piscesae TaxID=27915 RepID=A0AAD9NAI4_RIDPI|nr:hypothetical protein NP493_1579g00045 [Ridgeia piscesae]
MASSRRWDASPIAHPPRAVTMNATAREETSATNASAIASHVDTNEAIVSEFMRSLYTYDEPLSILLIGLYSVAFVVGLLGNLFVIAVVIHLPHMRTKTNMFLMNLAVGDLLVIVVGMPFTLAPYIYRNWVYGVVVCKLTPFVEGISVSVSVLTLLAISIDRLYAILRPMQARLLLSGRRVIVVLPAVWLVAIVIASPVIVVNDTAVQPVTHTVYVTTCEEKWRHIDWKNTYNVTVFVTLYVVPLLTMTAAYVMIARVLWRGDLLVHDVGHRREQCTSHLTRSRRRSVRLLVSVVATFAVSWMPYHVVNIYLDLNRSSARSVAIATHVYPLVQWLGLANSASNPLCYCLFSRSFCKALTQMCCFWRRRVSVPAALQRDVAADCGSLASTGDKDCIRVVPDVRRSRGGLRAVTGTYRFTLPRRPWAKHRRCGTRALKGSNGVERTSSECRELITTCETTV